MTGGRRDPPRVRIVALGDSTTAGTPGWRSPLESPPDGAGDETSQYAYWLMQTHPDWEVLNRGVNGERSDQIRVRFDRDVVQVRPAAVVIIAGVNDVYQGRPAEHVLLHLGAMYDEARRASIPAVAGSIIPYNTATAEQNARMREINDWIRRRASSSPGMAFVDTRVAAARVGDPDLLGDTVDGLHPTAAGYKVMAAAIQTTLERVLSAQR